MSQNLQAKFKKSFFLSSIFRIIILAIVLVPFAAFNSSAQYIWTEGFESGFPSSYPGSATNYTLSSGVWTVFDAQSETSSPTPYAGTYECHIKGTENAYIKSPSLNTAGAVTFYFNTTASSNPSIIQLLKSYSVSATTSVVATYTVTINSGSAGNGFTKFTTIVNDTNSALHLWFNNSAEANSVYLDNISVTATPKIQTSNISFSGISVNSMTVTWTAGSGGRRALFMGVAAPSSLTPVSGTQYTASANWSSKGTQIGSTGFYCIYDGNGTTGSVNLSNLTPGTTYYVESFEYGSDNVTTPTPATITYLTTTATGNPNHQATATLAATISSSGPICSGSAATLSFSGNAATTIYYWNGGTGATSSIALSGTTGTGTASVSVSPSVSATYTLTTLSSGGISYSVAGTASVNVNPLPSPTITGTTVIPSGGSAVLTFAGNTGDIVYYWNGTATLSTTISSSGTSTVTAAPSVTTTYSLTSAASAAGCSKNITGQTATVNVSATPTASINGAATICSGAATILGFSGTAGATVYYWNGGAGTTSSIMLSGTSGTGTATVSVSPSVTSTYSVSSVFSGGTSYTVIPTTAVITTSAAPLITSIVADASVCTGSTLHLNATINSGTAPYTYAWSGSNSFSNSITSSALTSSVIVTPISSTPASPSYTLTVTDVNGCLSHGINTVTTTVNPLPFPGTISGTFTVCSGTSVSFAASVAGGTWSSTNTSIASVNTSGSVTGTSSSTIIATTNITYTVTDLNGCTASTFSVVTVDPLPAVAAITGGSTVTTGSTITLTDATTGGTWSSSNPSIATNAAGLIRGIATGHTLISYSISNTYGCTGSAIAIITVNTPAAVLEEWPMSFGNTDSAAVRAAGVTSTTPTFKNLYVSSVSPSVALTAGTQLPPAYSTSFGQAFGDDIAGAGDWTIVSATPKRTYYEEFIIKPQSAYTMTVNSFLATTGFFQSVSHTDIFGVYSLTHFTTGDSTLVTGTTFAEDGGIALSPLYVYSVVPATVYTLTCGSGITVPPGDSLTMRFYFSCGSGTNNGRYACLKDVIAQGTNVSCAYEPALFTVSTATVCPGASGVIYTVPNDPTATSYTWSYSGSGATYTSAANSVSVNFSGIATSGTMSVVANTACGSSPARTMSVTVLPAAPATGTITGTFTVCSGNVTNLSESVSGGIWSSSNTGIATVNSAGSVGGITSGSVVVTYSVTGACGSAATYSVVTVNAHPVAGVISGLTALCVGSSNTLIVSGNSSSGTWSSANTNIATVNTSGAVTGINYGTVAISYNVSTACGIASTFTLVTVTGDQWTGATSISWNNAGNWSCGYVPTATQSVIIPCATAYTNAPTLDVNPGYAHNLTINSTAVLTLGSGNQLNVADSLTNNGRIIGSGAVYLNGSATQQLKGNGVVSNLTLGNNATIGTSGDTVGITGTLLLGSSTLTTNGALMLVSNASGTGVLGQITGGGIISGNTVMQQYIPGGRRAYRFVAHPFSTPVALSQIEPYIDITGAGGSGNGFTNTTTNSPSAYWYHTAVGNSSSGNDPGWVAYSNTSQTIAQYEGLRLFVRGSKGEGLYATIPYSYTIDPVTFRTYGILNTGVQSVTLSKGTGAFADFNLLGNPYPAVTNIGEVLNAAVNGGQLTGAAFYVWDPYMGTSGSFVTHVFTDCPSYYIGPDESFEVEATTEGATLTYAESNKGTTVSEALMRNAASEYLELEVYDSTYHPWDILDIAFSDAATNNRDAKYDALKLPSPASLNFYSWSADNNKLSFDARPFSAGKVIPLGLTTSYAQDFIIRAESAAVPVGGQVYLHDKYLQTYTLLQQGTEYHFGINKDSASQGDQRFELIMKATGIIAKTTKGIDVQMMPNPATSEVTISYTTSGKDATSVRVMNVAGVTVQTMDLGINQHGSATIDLGKMAAGVYMVEITSGTDKVVHRLVKE